MSHLPIFSRVFQKNREKGAILLEIAVGISVLAIISGFIVKKAMTTNKYVRERVTKSNIDTVVISIASFVANNQRLPRPAKTNNGIESDYANIKFGYIPYKTLGISSTIAKDGNKKDFIYIVEPELTKNYTKIYGDEFDINIFCKNIRIPQIVIHESPCNDAIAFAIDTRDHKNVIEETITIYPTAHTFWISRNMLLMKYLKSSPCLSENSQQSSYQHLQELEDDF